MTKTETTPAIKTKLKETKKAGSKRRPKQRPTYLILGSIRNERPDREEINNLDRINSWRKMAPGARSRVMWQKAQVIAASESHRSDPFAARRAFCHLMNNVRDPDDTMLGHS